MKRNFIYVSLAILSIATACKKEDVAPNSTSAIASTATITGVVRAETDNTNVTMDLQSGRTVLAKYNKADLLLNPDPNVSYPDVVISTTTDGNGNYTFTIPTGGQTVYVDILPQDFMSPVLTGPATSTPPQLFSASNIYIGISEKETQIIDINY